MLIPPRHIPKLILATAFAPAIVKNIRPLVKAAGKGLVKAGEFVEKLADEVEGKKPHEAANAEPMHEESVAAEATGVAQEEPAQAQESPVGEPSEAAAVVDEPAPVEPEADEVIEPEVVGTLDEGDAPNEA